MLNASASFHRRIDELGALEANTVRMEKSRKIKKKLSKDSFCS